MRHITTDKLWEISSNFESEMVEISDLKHILPENVWSEDTFSLERFVYHLKRCVNADRNHPVILVKDKGEYWVLDGMHRISLSIANNEDSIEAVVLPEKYNGLVILGE